jgi:hypothetical protein
VTEFQDYLLVVRRVSSSQTSPDALLASTREDIGKDCPNAKTTVQENSCISLVEQQAESDFATFYGILHSVLKRSTDQRIG